MCSCPTNISARFTFGSTVHVPFFGTYEEEALQAQRLGQAVTPPQLQ